MGIELIHAAADLTELRQINEFDQFDAVVSNLTDSTSDWMLKLPSRAWQLEPIEKGHYVYISDSEWGGPVSRVRHSTSDDTVRVYGTCWRGLLATRAICPEAGKTHVVYENMDANDVLRSMISGWMTTRVSVVDGESGIRCSGKIRYRDMLKAVDRLLEGTEGVLRVKFSGSMIRIWVEQLNDRSDEIEFSQEYECDIISERNASQYDHIIALGQGELLERTVVERWLLPDGTVTDDNSAEGVVSDALSRSYIYEYTAAETEDELAANAEKKLLSCAGGDSMEIVINSSLGELELGDRAAVRDQLTGILSVLSVAEKNLNISPDGMTVKHTLK